MPGHVPTEVASILAAQGICKSYGRTPVLDRVDLTVRPGEVVALTGENGAGKSTLLKICAGVLKANRGTVHVQGHSGYCPQSPGLFELLTADEHLVMFGRGLGLSRSESIARGHRLLAEFGFPTQRPTASRDMSGGTRQKLNLALAALGDPDLLLLDEPYQGFDRGSYVNFWEHCAAWQREGKAVVVVTHMLAELGLADRIVELPAHPTRKD